MSTTEKVRKAFNDCTVMAGVEPDFECVYMTKDAALLYLDEIDVENDRLQNELNAAKHDLSLFSERIVELGAENDKLRELCRRALVVLENNCSQCVYFYECDIVNDCNCVAPTHIRNELRELGIEV